MIKAVSSFDYTKGTRFATYAARCIDNEILMHFRYLKKSAGDIYFDEPVDTDKDGNQLTLIDIIASDGDLCDEVDLKINSEVLRGCVESLLDNREKEIIILRYGLCGMRPLTQRECADLLGISRSYVSRIEKRAIEKISAKMK